ncbi:phenylalanine 4-monooxygenase [bacterium (Candidatus Blackallbacteria) CG17_big_fil_post_rev_8_21_14_2_50_48_46]|uniref:Phenylalanine 4-monooxygenase n=1 Tax=bacterium (Candidatus Blackallbacteria) CG17_big_fil_post_rev_8_21_14_2_50_48_46 TaxID=2014261 RepID=A0A2M7G133_9BACT|nr:MAG: phenylalanine 4-monooxygenase [bacterium (Candidatus Blackallbacteria) CG18_big_fil_WC_8_21_14_2_50_49_26]PIW15418.1 MAG: phenylalanine 4-monooxygenase [bacterium (Candidatus Blackallbacteria) CG17_big_fil_post_rev_8_21_14_2_50_48_46]PIW49721.1 MAG: phenylalanine 4-monooxygenase [bacterium (Candidatus Blackallbacteria) CG13_big_fil_rev_8_21_14_2_50_49_14]
MSDPGAALSEGDFQAPEQLSAYERAGLEGKDPRCIPIKIDSPLPIGDEIEVPSYTPDQQAVWQYLLQRQLEILPGRACQAFLKGLEALKLPPDRIPSLPELSKTLEATTQWRVARTPGLLHEQDFFELLAQRVFPSTDYIRERHELDYTPAPDLFHDIFGHLPMITEPDFADFYQRYGQASLKATGLKRRQLESFHWFTVEFGLVREKGEPRIYGNGIVSSYKETFHALGHEVKLLPFDPEVMGDHPYEVWHLQPVLFVVDSFEALKEGFENWAGGKLGLL